MVYVLTNTQIPNVHKCKTTQIKILWQWKQQEFLEKLHKYQSPQMHLHEYTYFCGKSSRNSLRKLDKRNITWKHWAVTWVDHGVCALNARTHFYTNAQQTKNEDTWIQIQLQWKEQGFFGKLDLLNLLALPSGSPWSTWWWSKWS